MSLVLLTRAVHTGDVSLDATTSSNNSHASGLHVSSNSYSSLYSIIIYQLYMTATWW